MKTWTLNKKAFIIFLAWLTTTLLTLDAAIGSYGEFEPKAGNILFVATAVFVAIGAFLYYKYKPTFILID